MPSSSGIRTSIEHDVGAEPSSLLHRRPSVGRLAGDLHVFLGLEDHPEACTDERLVIDDEHPYAARLSPRRLARQHELEDPYRPLEVLELLLAEVDEGELLVLEQGVRRLGDENLASLAGGADARRAMDGQAVVLVGGDRCLTRVDAHSDARLHVMRPLVADERLLSRQRRGDGFLRSPERYEERVSLGADAFPTRLLEDVAEDPVMLREHVPVALAELDAERVEPSMSVSKNV